MEGMFADENLLDSEGLFEPNVLKKKFNKDELIELIRELQVEKKKMQEQQMGYSDLCGRVVELERSQQLYEQYGRTESIEIHGIPEAITQNNLQAEVIRIYKEAKVKVEGDELCAKDISACHRIGRKGHTIIRFVNRKFAYEGLRNGKNLKGTTLYEDKKIFINNSFCKAFSKYGYFIRKLKNDGEITGYKIKHGVYQIQLEKSGDFFEVSHIIDFDKYSLDVSIY